MYLNIYTSKSRFELHVAINDVIIFGLGGFTLLRLVLRHAWVSLWVGVRDLVKTFSYEYLLPVIKSLKLVKANDDFFNVVCEQRTPIKHEFQVYQPKKSGPVGHNPSM